MSTPTDAPSPAPAEALPAGPRPAEAPPAPAADLQELGVAVLNGVYALVRALRLYDPNNASIGRIVDELHGTLQPWLARTGEAVRLTVMTDQVFVNERLVKADPTLYERITALYERLEPLGVNELEFRADLSRDDVLAFVGTLSEHTRGPGRRMGEAGTERITVRQVEGDAVAAYRLPPDRLAVWLYASLLDLTEQLYARVAQGESPSLVPLRRALQLLVDHLPGHSGVFQLLAALRDPSPPPSTANRRVLVAIELLGFGHWLGLPARELLPLGMAGILGGLALGREAERPVRALLRFSGLGELAMPVALVLHDAVAARTSAAESAPLAGAGEATLAGRALAMVEAYALLVAGREGAPPRSPLPVCQSLARGQPAWVGPALGSAFAAYKGAWPLGCLVRLDDGSVGIVVSRPEAPQPVVLAVDADGRAGARLDLARGPLRATAVLEPARVPIRISQLVRDAASGG